jgi:hypothetical protein
MPGGNKFAGGRHWPPVVIGGHCRTVSDGVHHRGFRFSHMEHSINIKMVFEDQLIISTMVQV